MHLVYSDAHLKYTDIVYTKRINEVYAVAHTIVLQPLLHSDSVLLSLYTVVVPRVCVCLFVVFCHHVHLDPEII